MVGVPAMLLGMDLTQPLSSLIPTLEAETLTVLARTEQPLTGRRVAQLARRGTHPAVQKVLDRLVAHGLVDVQPAGAARLYLLNREHLLASAVLVAVTARETLLDRMRGTIDGWEVPCEHASLFGSLARGEANRDSDIDVLVVRPDTVGAEDPIWQHQLQSLEQSVTRWAGNPLSWFETTEEDLVRALNREQEPIVEAWRRDAIQLAGEPLRELLGRVEAATVSP